MKQHTILIVDDQAVNRKILKKLLSGEYEILEAENGRAAMETLESRAGAVSAVLLDIVMPVMDGYEVLAAMAADPALCKIPVIVSSQKDGDEAEVRALSLGAQDFIAKPYKADIINHRLRNTIKLRETAAIINRVEKDELTGLFNKQFFLENLAELLARNPEQSYDLVCFGIERFKLINETFGTARGDTLLKHIAQMLSAAPTPLLAARFNADIFYFVLPHRAQYDPEAFAPHLRALSSYFVDMDIKVNCGIYEITDRGAPPVLLCDRARLAAEKNKGMYDVPFSYYDDSLRQKLLEEQFITGNMRSALAAGQFHVYYQPKYDLNNELVAGAEALVRWIHPEKGMLSPGAFIPLFERSGFITQMDQYVWETACRDIRGWMDRGLPPVAISVNVSRADIYNPRLTEILLGLVEKYKIPIHYLHLEITESAYTNNPEQIIHAVDRLRELGFIIEMDDFGSGYSSLNMLADMPVDVLKLDMGFIQHETQNTSGKGILSFVISLAKWLNLAVVAEGVETAEQIATLRSMDCNYVQGFYFAKPMSGEDFEHLLKSSKVTEMICSSQTAHQYVAARRESGTPSDRVMLVVDDIEVNRAVLAGTFSGQYTIVEKENGATAWAYLDQHFQQVDIVMLDLLMPVMDGFQLLDKIRFDPRMQDLPVMITSQGDGNSEQRALDMQADDFISKPYNPDMIRHRVRNVLESRRLRRLMQAEDAEETPGARSDSEEALRTVQRLKPHFDLVRLVDAEHTLVCEENCLGDCQSRSCFSVWGKSVRCSNCVSLRALHERGRFCKLENSESGLYFVISEFVPLGESGAVIEMITKLEDSCADNVRNERLLCARRDNSDGA